MSLLAALFSHYRRHPLQLLALAAMILVATMLWSGVSHLTSQARASLGQSEQAVAERRQIERRDGEVVTVADFVTLRRAGVCVMPWLEVDRPSPAGRLVGIDPMAAACFSGASEAEPGEGRALDGEPFLDISEAVDRAQAEEDATSRLFLLVPEDTAAAALPDGYRITDFFVGPQTGELGESFLLNLDALAVLVLLITALLLRSVYQLGMAQRRDSFVLLHRFGVLSSRIKRLLILEIVLLAATCVLPGLWLGRLLAGAVGSGFGQALEGLFDIPLYAGQGDSWLMPALTMMLVVVAVCGADYLKPLFPKLPLLKARAPRGWALIMVVTGLILARVATSLPLLFVAVALAFAGCGLLVPDIIAGFASRHAGKQKDPLQRWRYRELDVLARRLALPLVALQFALAMVLAVQALVTVFESTFDEWLSQRLAAGYFIQVPAGAEVADAVTWLRSQAASERIGHWHRVARGDARISGVDEAAPVVDLFAVAPLNPMITGWDLQSARTDPWPAFAAGKGVMVNEQLARRYGIGVEDTLTVSIAGQPMPLPVLGVYADYGRPAGEVMVSATHLPPAFKPSFESISVNPGETGVASVVSGLKQVWKVDQLTVRDNRKVRELAATVFDQTFLLTRAMTFVTLVLAAVALLLMGWVFFSTRVRYFRLLMVWGMRQRQVAGQLGRLSITLTSAVALLAWPLGVWLTWVLVHRINPLAFGWSLPMAVYPAFWLELALLSLVVGLAIAVLMRRQLRAPGSLPLSAGGLLGGER